MARTERCRGEGLEWGTGIFTAGSKLGVASSWYTMPLPLVSHLPNYLQLGLKLGFELVKLLCLLCLRVQAALLVLCELAQELLLLGQHPGTV